MFKITNKLPYNQISIGGELENSNSTKENLTNDWRSRRPKWIREKCIQCGLCWPVCPDDCITILKEMKRDEFNYDYCKGCGVCAKMCPVGAIVMVEEGCEENE